MSAGRPLPYPPEMVEMIAAMAQHPDCVPGEVAEMARRFGRSENAIRIAVSRKRCELFGRPLRSALANRLTPQQMRDYRTLTAYGYRRAEALAAIGVG